jgi:hypothetical protein
MSEYVNLNDITKCLGCNKKFEDGEEDRWTCLTEEMIHKGHHPWRFAHWKCIKKYNLCFTPVS